MKPQVTLLAPLALVALGSIAADELRFDVESGTRVTKTFRDQTEWTLELIDIEVGGEPVSMDLPECTGTTKRWLELTDEYVETDDGRIDSLRRSFESLGSESVFEVEDMGTRRCACASELEGTTVLFRRDGDEFERSFDGAGADLELLRGLEADVDLLGFLPRQAVEPGDSWEVEAEDLARLIGAGGQLAFLPSEADEGDAEEIPTQYILANALFNLGEAASSFTGEGTATYAGRDDDGLARIEVELELKADVDRTRRFQTYLEHEMDDVVTDDLELGFAIELTGQGVVVWNPKAGRAESAELELDFSMTTRVAWREPSVRIDGEPALFAADIELGGTSTIALGVTE